MWEISMEPWGGDINSVSRDEEANNYRQEDGVRPI